MIKGILSIYELINYVGNGRTKKLKKLNLL
jgi:hypothetical protein